MLGHYFSAAFSHFMRFKAATFINVVCLALGMAGFFAAHHENTSSRSAEYFFPGSERIYLMTQKTSVAGSDISIPTVTAISWVAAEHLREDFPELEAVARSTQVEEAPVSIGAEKTFLRTRYVDADFLRIFALPFVAGDSLNALREPRSAVMLESTAIRLFGSAQAALGRTVLLENRHEVTIRGVTGPVRHPFHMADYASNYQYFDLLVSMDVYEAGARHDPVRAAMLRQWTGTAFITFVLLPENGSLTAQAFNQQLRDFASCHIPSGNMKIEFGSVHASAMNRVGLNTFISADSTGVDGSELMYMLGVLLLGISCLNYANLATAQATARAREVGMRRVVGARRSQVVFQHLFEAGLLSLFALLIVVIIAAVMFTMTWRPGWEYVLQYVLSQPAFWLGLLLAWAGVTLAAGAYPALVLSRIQPADALRAGQIKTGASFMPSVLVGLQFGLASLLLTSVLVMSAQIRKVQEAAFAGTEDPVVILPTPLTELNISFEALRSELLRQPHVRSVTGSLIAPWSRTASTARVATSPDSAARTWAVSGNFVNYDYFETLGFKLLAGRVFERGRAEGSALQTNVVIDRALSEQLGWTSPEEAIGQILHLRTIDDQRPPPLRVIGVVENKPLTLMGLGATSNLYYLTPPTANIVSIRIDKANVQQALQEIDAAWNNVAPNVPIKRQLAQEAWRLAYQPFQWVNTAFKIIAGLAFANAMLGLVGMTLHVIGRRMHEIGVRKTLGASFPRVLAMLLRDCTRPILIANIVAWPLAYLAMKAYLSIFAQRVELSLTPFLLSLVITLCIAWLAIAAQTTRAARVNPATVLRYE